MAAKTTFTPAQKAKFLKQTRALTPKSAAAEIGISVQTLYSWRRAEAKPKTEPTKATVKTKTAPSKPVALKKTETPKTSKPTKTQIKKALKAFDMIQAKLKTVEVFLKQTAA